MQAYREWGRQNQSELDRAKRGVCLAIDLVFGGMSVKSILPPPWVEVLNKFFDAPSNSVA